MCKPCSGVYPDESARGLGASAATKEGCRTWKVPVSMGLAAPSALEDKPFAMKGVKSLDILPLDGGGIRGDHAAHLLAGLKDATGAQVRGCFNPHAGAGTGSTTEVGPPGHPKWTDCLLLYSEQSRESPDQMRRPEVCHMWARSTLSGVDHFPPVVPRPPPPMVVPVIASRSP